MTPLKLPPSGRWGLKLLTVLDANLNRAREGIRVCEEVARFCLRDRNLMHRFQRLRYDLARVEDAFSRRQRYPARDSQRDVGRPSLRRKFTPHRKIRDLVSANGKRIEEALRVCEEFTRLTLPKVSRLFARLRFRAYTLEADLLLRL